MEKKKILVIDDEEILTRTFVKLLERNGYDVLQLTKENEIIPFLESFFKQHMERRSLTSNPSSFAKKEVKDFYLNLSRHFSEPGGVIFTVIKSQGEPIAFHFGFAYNKKFLWYKPSFDVRLAKHSPGEVLLKELLEYAYSHHYEEFDFSIGEEPFKKRFANIVRKNLSFKIFKSSGPYYLNRMVTAFKKIKNL